jgi:hypothetical protein
MRLNQLTKPAPNIWFRNVVNSALARSNTFSAPAACLQQMMVQHYRQNLALS